MVNAPVDRTCPVCDQRAAAPLFSKGELHMVRCQRCGMIYANPVAPELASGQFYDRLGTPFYLSPDKLESDYAPVRFERELRLFRAYCTKGQVLDVGCSTGAFLYQLTQQYPKAYSVCGMDVTGAALDYAESRGVPVLRDSFLEHDFGERRFDAITFWAVMEHLVHPKQFLHQAAGLLEPGGHLILLVPNMRSLAVRLLGPGYRYIMPDHVNYFTQATFAALVQTEPELSIVAQGSMHFNPIVIIQDWRTPQDRVPDAQRAQLLKRTTAYKQHPLLKPVKAIYRLVEMVLGRWRLADNLYLVARRRGTAERAGGL